MIIRWMLYVFVSLTPYAYVDATMCQILDRIETCKYTIVCENHAGSASNPECYKEPYVTFQMINSRADILSKGFFGATNFDSRVRVLTAINNTWTTLASDTFSYYTKIIEINFSGNQIREIRNEAFKNVFALKYLNLSNNFIETLHSYSLLTAERIKPEASFIKTLDLSNNLLQHIARDAMHPCPNVEELYLQNNNIAELDDNVFSNLNNLTRLDLRNNKLTALNLTLVHLKQLIDLDLSYNTIYKLSGFETNRLISLKRVNISNNMITTIESNCFNQAFNLESLDLSNNNISSTIATIMFINNGKLSYLNLYNNNISKIEENAFQKNSLVSLYLDKNHVSGEITEATFAGLQKVKNLNLCKQNITSINADAFKDMTNLVNLNLSANNIGLIHELGFKNLASLVILDLSYNNITYVNFFKNALTNLTEVNLNNNKIKVIPGHAFVNQTLLIKMDISNNRITTIEQYSLPLSNLQFLNISGNPLTGSLLSNMLSPGQYLRYLDLSSLNLTRIENMALIDLPVLARLNLSNNAIEYIAQKNFLHLNNVFSLDLSHNRLSNLQLNGTFMKSLNALYLNNNNISNIADAIPNSTEIMYLDISHNNITELTGTAFETLKKLVVLRVLNNKIRIFNNPQVNLLSKLEDLDVSSNQISVIDLKFYKGLVRVDISNNSLNIINSSLLRHLDHLQVLNIDNNNISVIPPGIFQNTNILRIVNVSFNSLTNLRYGSLRGLHNAEVIDLSRNNITEIDVDVFHECEKLARLVIDYNHIKYLDVDKLINVVPKLTSVSIGGNPISCKQIVHSIRNINKASLRSVEITSIHKVFHEDNVYGIRCGDVNLPTTITPVNPSNTSKFAAATSHSSVLIIWCSVLTIFFVVLIAAFLFWKHQYASAGTYFQTRMQLRRSVELNGSEFQSDLLN